MFYCKSILRRLVHSHPAVLQNVVVALSSVEHVLDLIETQPARVKQLMPSSFAVVARLLRPDKADQDTHRARRVLGCPTNEAPIHLDTTLPVTITQYAAKGKWPDVSRIGNLAISPSGNAIAYSQDAEVRRHALPDKDFYGNIVGTHRKPINTEKHNRSASITGITFSACGQFILSIDDKGTLMVWSCRDAELVEMLTVSEQAITSVAFSADGRFCATAGYDEVIRVFRTAYPAALR